MFSVKDIYRSFHGKQVLKGVSFDVAESSINALIGPSGSGKSVLMKVLAHTSRMESGTITLGNNSTVTDIGLMFQEGALFDSLSVYDNVAFPLVQGRVPTTTLPCNVREEVCGKVSEILARVGLSRAAHKMPGQISGGMRRRVSLARALVQRPKILLLDDPTSGLDPVASRVIMDLIVELHREYRPTTVMVSQDLRRLLPACERILALFDGRIVFDGSLQELATSAPPEVKEFVSCRFELDTICHAPPETIRQ